MLSLLNCKILALFITSFLLSAFSFPAFIDWMQRLQKKGQPIRLEYTPEHSNKVGTPTLGGAWFLFCAFSSMVCWNALNTKAAWLLWGVLLGFGALGFWDDWYKIQRHNPDGQGRMIKFVLQWLLALFFCALYAYVAPQATEMFWPFQLGLWSVPLLLWLPCAGWITVSSTNAVNLTDGLDGLAISSFLIVLLFLMGLAWRDMASGTMVSFDMVFYRSFLEVSATLLGSCLGFFWYNTYPAQIFMGDAGSLALGAYLGFASLVLHRPFALLLMGIVFVVETLSCLIQIYCYKKHKARPFLMAPLHHHFQKKGYPEAQIVNRFLIVTVVCSMVGFLIF